MGTSNVRFAVRSPSQKSLVQDIAAQKTQPLVRTAIRIALPALPVTHSAEPLYYALLAGLATSHESDFQNALKSSLKGREKPELSLGEAVWNRASELAGSSAKTQGGRIAESALKRTFAYLLQKYSAQMVERDASSLIDAIGKRVTDEEFVQRFLTNYLLELTLFQIRTADDDPKYSAARAYHYAGGRLLGSSGERAFRTELLENCEALAKRITRRVSKAGLIEEAKDGRPPNDRLIADLREALSEVLQDRGDRG
jgi:hypothetical protein